jgi:hypothetical protein
MVAWTRLPDELWMAVAASLSAADVARLSAVCWRLFAVARDPLVWTDHPIHVRGDDVRGWTHEAVAAYGRHVVAFHAPTVTWQCMATLQRLVDAGARLAALSGPSLLVELGGWDVACPWLVSLHLRYPRTVEALCVSAPLVHVTTLSIEASDRYAEERVVRSWLAACPRLKRLNLTSLSVFMLDLGLFAHVRNFVLGSCRSFKRIAIPQALEHLHPTARVEFLDDGTIEVVRRHTA